MLPEDSPPVNHPLRRHGPLLALVAVGLALRAWQVDWGLPHPYHPDEPGVLVHVLPMLEGDLVVRTYVHGPLQKYLVWIVASVAGVDPEDPWAMVRLAYIGRWLSVVAGTCTIPAAWALARPLVPAGWALLAAALVAVMPLPVTLSRYAVTDPWLALFFTLATALAVQCTVDPRPRWWALGGVCTGLALGAKISAAVLGLPWAVAVAAVAMRGARRHALVGAAAALGGLLAGLVVAYPSLPWSWEEFRLSLRMASRQAAEQGHRGIRLGPEEVGWLFYPRTALAPVLGPVAAIAGLYGLGASVLRRRSGDLVLLAAALPYLVIIEAAYKVPPAPDRYALPLVGPVAVWIALGTALLAFRLPWERAGRVLATVLVLAWPVVDVVGLAADLPRDTRDEAARWMVDNLPAGARIVRPGLSFYQPALDERFNDEQVDRFDARHADYVVLSSFSVDRWLEHPDQDPEMTALIRSVRGMQQVFVARPRWRTYQFHEPVIEIHAVSDRPRIRLPAESPHRPGPPPGWGRRRPQ